MTARIEMCKFEVIPVTAETQNGQTIVAGYTTIQHDCGKPSCPTSKANNDNILRGSSGPSQN